jgi:predicted MFS family arabinose efflux permease
VRYAFLLAIGTFALGLDAYVLTGLLPGISTTYGVSTAAAGQVVTGFTLAYALASPILAAMLARQDCRRILLGALGVFGAANVAGAAAAHLWVLITARVVAGVGAGLYAPIAAATAGQLVGEGRRGRALSIVLGGLTLATVIGVPVGLLLGIRLGWRATLLLVAAVALLAAIGVRVFLPPSALRAAPGLKTRFAVLGDRFVLARVSVMLMLGIANLGLYTYLAAILYRSDHLTAGQLPGYLLLWGAGGAIGNSVIGWFLDRGAEAGALLATMIGLLAIVLFVLPLGGTRTAGVAVLLFAWGFAAWSLQVPLQYQLTTAVPEHAATAVGLIASAVYLGSAIGSAVDGLVLTQVPPTALPIVAGAFAVTALAIHYATRHAPPTPDASTLRGQAQLPNRER